jgi:uncharacterized membrane protein
MQVATVSAQVNDVVNNLAEKLHVPVTILWTTLVREAVIEGWNNVIWGFFFLGGAIATIFIAKHLTKSSHAADDPMDFVLGLLAIAVAIGGGVSLVVGLTQLHDALPMIYNPQYFAVKHILDAL